MTVLLALAMLLVAGAATAVVLTRDPLRQAAVASGYGLALAVLFVLLRAPDVAISAIVVAAVFVPALVLLTLAKTAGRNE